MGHTVEYEQDYGKRDGRDVGRLVPEGTTEAQGFNLVLTLGTHTKKANRPERAADLELPDSGRGYTRCGSFLAPFQGAPPDGTPFPGF